jgi:deoxyhypusine synthase
MLAAKEMGIPVYTPGWEDSTTGNMFAAAVWRGEVPQHHAVKSRHRADGPPHAVVPRG